MQIWILEFFTLAQFLVASCNSHTTVMTYSAVTLKQRVRIIFAHASVLPNQLVIHPDTRMQIHTIAIAIWTTLRLFAGAIFQSMVCDHTPFVLPPILTAVGFMPAGSMGALSCFSFAIKPNFRDAEVA